ncbi:glycoside hydrolase family 3 N-terminal domain-containing protein, partial [Streptococcus suis]|uniref:glycoside hydrolase family 3 N-terminal domain-containing protein n=1 Tax=Streptococcus suis TaxID=1307 RepID=UPI00370430D1
TQYGYDGIIVTDAMGMDAISQNFGESEAAIMAIQAGVDIVLMPTVLRNKLDLAKIDAIIDDIEAAVAQGHITEGMLDDSVRRILRLKAKRGVLDFDLAARTAEAANQAVGSDLNRDLERQIAASA